MDIPNFANKEEKFKFFKDNKSFFINQKKSTTKEADTIVYQESIEHKNGEAIKKDSEEEIKDLKSITVKVAINTTNLLDSHGDVHIQGLWKKTLSEKKELYLLQEHQMKFDKIISGDVQASTKKMNWEKLGFDFQGQTEVLIFDAEIKADRNEFMFEQYLKGYVKNHSVGMRYVNILMCINSEEKYYVEEKANWDKYYPMVANKDQADSRGMFWAVTEAKLIEGSAVVIGSNVATPTIQITENKNTDEAEVITSPIPQNEPITITQKNTHLFINPF